MSRSGLLFGQDAIQAHVPHRATMLLLDGITAFEDGSGCTSVRRVRADEPFLDGHFPGNPVVPGIYLIENMAQTACFFLERSTPGLPGTAVLARVEKSTFLAIVRPGAELETRVIQERAVGALTVFSATCAVAGRIVARANLVVGRAVEAAQAQSER